MACNDLPHNSPRAQPPLAAPGTALTVWYDGACPLCQREISIYRQARPWRKGQTLCFVDVNDPHAKLPKGVTRPSLLARFHVQDGSGQLHSGALAFVALWSALPGWRWLAAAARLPGATWALERLYRLFLRVRPRIQQWLGRWR